MRIASSRRRRRATPRALARAGAVLAALGASGCDPQAPVGTDPSARRPQVVALASGGGVSWASYSHTCGVASGAVQCWGAAGVGQLGFGGLAGRSPVPLRVAGIEGRATAVASGVAHSCAVAGGRVFCWGNNVRRQVSPDAPNYALAAVPVPGLPEPATAVAAGDWHSCAVARGELWCWGQNRAGVLGSPPRETCRELTRAVPCSESPRRVPGLPGPVTDVALGRAHACALADGELYCWGDGGRGQRGDGRAAGHAPTRVAELLDVRALAAGADHSCALASGAVHCWGANESGQLGDGSQHDRSRPVPARGVSGAEALAAGASHTCAATARGVLCWGDNAEGQLGSRGAPQSAEPQRVPGLAAPVSALAAGNDSSCAARASGVVSCWGDNDFGQLGNGDAPRDHTGPVDVSAWDEGRIRDRDGDGRIVIACLGDSNTQPRPGKGETWCEGLEELLADATWRTVNRGLGGAAAVPGLALTEAAIPLAYALENDAPDVVILAYGTNDLLQGAEVEAVASAYRTHLARVRESGAEPFLALTPPVRRADPQLAARIGALNARLRELVPASRVIDFHAGFTDEDFADDLHLAPGGHAKRARAAFRSLRAAGAAPEAG